MRLARACVLLAGCGRFGFGTLGAGDSQIGDVGTGSDAIRDTAGDVSGDAAPACLASYELCDGFETDLNTQIWTAQAGVTVDGTVAHRGTRSVHAHIDATASGTQVYAMLYQTKTLPLGDQIVYVRAYFRLSALPATNNHMEAITVIQSGGGAGDYLFVQPDALYVYSQFSLAVMNNGTLPPVGSWFCALWTLDRSTTSSGSITLAGDEPGTSLTATQTDGVPSVDEMAFGIGFSANNVKTAQPALDVWVDDIIVSNAPVTCAD